jgi:hypothetical protein
MLAEFLSKAYGKVVAIIALLASILTLNHYTINKEIVSGPYIAWQEQKIERSVNPGERFSLDFGFITKRDLQNVNIWITPEISSYVISVPSGFPSIPANSVSRVQLIFTIPQDIAFGTYDGTVHIREGERTFAKPLPISFTVVPKPSPTPSPGIIELFYDDGTAEGFDFDPVHGRAMLTSKFSLGEGYKIVGAKIYFKLSGQPASQVLLHIWDFERRPMIDPVPITPDSDGWFIADLSSFNLSVSNEFYLGISWPTSDNAPLLGVDLSSGASGQSFVVVFSEPSDVFIPVTNSNFMIRALVEKL